MHLAEDVSGEAFLMGGLRQIKEAKLVLCRHKSSKEELQHGVA